MIYVWAAIAIAVLFLIWQIVRWWNLPATIAAREKSAAARSERWRTRPGLFGRRLPKAEEEPVKPPRVIPANPGNLVEVIPEIKKPEIVPKDGLLARRRRKRLERKHGR